jgi:hypothetical protein
MHLNTYRSEAVPGIFVTLPSTATSTIQIVDDLAALRLNLVKRGYEFSDEMARRPFVVSVLTQIVDHGYAMHGPDPAFEGAARH